MASGTAGARRPRLPDRLPAAHRKGSGALGRLRRGGAAPGDVTDISTPGPPPWRMVVAMTSTTHGLALFRARTGGPRDDDGPKILEHVLGWTLVVLLAVLVTRAGLM
ncbi:SCO1431 family membrane protein [Streptomyces sp. NPDC088915]|uniref:SCO1431 family membrane protein n=1 Tax=Streptomyces sp. NPDC088915 TaxID=3365912 RepID=UPI00382E3938